MCGEWPSEIDHINGDKSDNSYRNLREVSRGENMQNKRKAHRNNKTGFLGVAREAGKYRARIRVCGKNRSLGMYDTPQQAHQAYLAAKRELHEGCTI